MVRLAYELGFPCCKPLKRNDEEEEENRKNGETFRCSSLYTPSISSPYTVDSSDERLTTTP